MTADDRPRFWVMGGRRRGPDQAFAWAEIAGPFEDAAMATETWRRLTAIWRPDPQVLFMLVQDADPRPPPP